MKSAFQENQAGPILRQFLALLAMCLLTGCGQSYVVDKESNTVTYVTSDEGRGTVKTVITNADAATFELMHLSGPTPLARDKNHVYMYGSVITGAHPESFQRFPVPGEPHNPRGANYYYYRDSQHVFQYAFSLHGPLAMLPDSDPATFQLITNGQPLNRICWSRDRTRVYYFDWGFVPKDIDTFEPLERGWARDSQAYYWSTHEVEGADRDTFQITGMGTGFDRHYSYQLEEIWNTNHTELQRTDLHKQLR